jgi:DNA invertase Pin-like site-specific DNA recombinase
VLDRKVDALRVADCERIYDDRSSGATAARPGRSACLDYLRRDDPAGGIFLQIQAAFAEMGRNLIRQRVREGAAVRGRKGRRPQVMTPERLPYAQHRAGPAKEASGGTAAVEARRALADA